MVGPALRAGIAYAALAYAAGFVLGALRLSLLAPRVGELAAVLAETPVILAVCWVVCARMVRRFAVPATAPARLAMGGVALVCLLAAEVALAAAAFGQAPAAFLAGLVRPPGAVGLAGQLLFALFPRMQLAWR